MIVNLYVDHLMAPPPSSAEEVWNATREHAKLFSDAAMQIGLTPAEYKEFRSNLLDGKAVYVKLPRRLDAMSGVRHGSVYAVKNATMTQPVMGWRVALSDGNVVYVPQLCGNISLLRHAAVAYVPPKYVAHARHVPYTPAIAKVPETPVIVTPEEPPPETPPTVAQAIPAASSKGAPFFFLIPAAVAGVVAGVTHGSTPVPPCSHGSNVNNACQK